MNEKSKPETAIQSSKDASKVIIEINGMHKWFGAFHVLKNINLTVNTGERIVICGPSGSGKSTLIRCINRLEEHQEGTIVVDDVELTGDLKNIEIIRSEIVKMGNNGVSEEELLAAKKYYASFCTFIQ